MKKRGKKYQNINKKIDRAYRRRIFLNRRVVRYAVNIARVALRRGVTIWQWNADVPEVPTYPEGIYEHLKERGIANSQFYIMVRKEDDAIEKADELGSFRDFARLVFVLTK